MDSEYIDVYFDGKISEKNQNNAQNIKERIESNQNLKIKVYFSNEYPIKNEVFEDFKKFDLSSKISHLRFNNFFHFDGCFFAELAKQQKNFPNLQELFLNNVHLTNLGNFLDFFNEDNLKNLESLGFCNTNINDNFILDLSNKPFKKLMVLNLNSSFKLTSQAFIDLFNSEMVRNLQSLSMQNLEITNEGVLALCFYKKCENLQELDLSLCSQLTDLCYLNLIMSPNLKFLKKLHLFNTMVTSKPFLDFDRRGILNNLTVLRLEENYGIEAEGYGCIGTSKLFENLEYLQISMSKIDDQNFKKIYDSPFLKKLKTLIFYDNPKISRVCLKEFFQSYLAQNLEELDLTWMDLDDLTVKCLGNALKNIKNLKIVNCKSITTEGFCELISCGSKIKYLEKLNLSVNEIDKRFIDLFKEKTNNSEINIKELDIRKSGNKISLQDIWNFKKEMLEKGILVITD